MPSKYSQLRVLAFDYGLKRIGVAVGRPGTATPIATLQAQAGKINWSHLDKLVTQWRPQLLLVGLARQKDGSLGTVANKSVKFARVLQQRYKLECVQVDERLTSWEASLLPKGNKDKANSNNDALVAALLIDSLQDENSVNIVA